MFQFFKRHPDLWTEGGNDTIRKLKKTHIDALKKARNPWKED